MDPRSLRIRQFALPGEYNMWCYVFNNWGQGIVGDGTTANRIGILRCLVPNSVQHGFKLCL